MKCDGGLVHYAVHSKDRLEWGEFVCHTLLEKAKRKLKHRYTFARDEVTCRRCLRLTELILPARARPARRRLTP